MPERIKYITIDFEKCRQLEGSVP